MIPFLKSSKNPQENGSVSDQSLCGECEAPVRCWQYAFLIWVLTIWVFAS